VGIRGNPGLAGQSLSPNNAAPFRAVLIYLPVVSVSVPSDEVVLLSPGLGGGWTKPGAWLEPVKWH